MINNGTDGINSAKSDARIDTTAFTTSRGRRTVSVVDAFTSRFTPALDGVTHVAFRAGTLE